MSLEAQFLGFCQTNDIITNELFPSYPVFEFPKINLSPAILADLENIPKQGASILGKKMEAFFKIAIKHSPRYELIDHSIQIIQDKQTLGEFDFLVFDKDRDQNLHVELVYKLYLYDASFEKEIDRWIGPKRKDSLHRKLNRLRQKQFPLLKHPASSSYLEKYGLNSDEIEQQICFKAQLFSKEKSSNYELINQNCLTGQWIHFKEFTADQYGKFQYYSPKKLEWSSDPSSNWDWMEYSEILEKIERLFNEGQVPLVWMKKPNTFYSFFIVNW